MKRAVRWVVSMVCLAGCGASTGASIETGATDASVTDSPPTPRDPAGRWRCDVLLWNPQRMAYTSTGASQVPVTIARTSTGITWQAEFLPGATTPALDLVTRGPSWSLAAPFRPPAPGPDLGGSIETLDVSWRGERLWALLTGTLSTVAGPMPLREAYDCVRAP